MHSAASRMAKNHGQLVKRLLAFTMLLCIFAVFFLSTAAALQGECYCSKGLYREVECDCRIEECEKGYLRVEAICSFCEMYVKNEIPLERMGVLFIPRIVNVDVPSVVRIAIEPDLLRRSFESLVEANIRINN